MSFGINKPSAGELASLCGSYDRFERQVPRGGDPRRLDLLRSRPLPPPPPQSQQQSFSSSQSWRESQVTARDLVPRPLPICSRSDDVIEERLAALENLVAGVAESVSSMRKSLDDQNREVSFMLKEEEGTIKRVVDQIQAVPAKLSGDLKAALREEIKQALLESDEKTVSQCIPSKDPRDKTPSSVETKEKKGSNSKRKSASAEEQRSDDSTTLDLYSPSAKELKKMRDKVLRARRSIKKRV
ncbi:hypothetical protein SELMODRAFT_428908 [Selaginella moellendorffii]|uniref:Uncharacterized protein n=1 Tax=Selaginella moellendorffii TaxID=88036 RepID=D8T4E2_SELML|nr:uncharacterized protein LOC9631509 [Selaginella moellendorffii]EFJ08510.1 hypothetical protein SELMODRAFT_428908 [Selaginella moellendorffii]|eukprot:XP_002990417.1 uncharacterized protein LOC9631509 [Selaginella moellendorffii]